MHAARELNAETMGEETPRKQAQVSLVVPAFNEERGIETLVRTAAAQLATLAISYEVVVVDDGSTDSTAALLDNLRREIAELRVIRARVNSGQHIASFIGLREAVGDVVFVADADLTHALPALPRLYAVIQEDPRIDIVSAVRGTRGRSLYRSLGSRVVGALVNRITGSQLRDPASPLRLYRRRVVDAITEADVLAQNMPILTLVMGFSVKEIDVEMSDSGRSSRYRFFSLVHVLLLALLNFSSGTKTMLTLIALGACSTGTGLLGLIGLTVRGVVAHLPLSTNLILLFVMLIVVGLQFILMGGIAYKIERINTNLRFRRFIAVSNYDE